MSKSIRARLFATLPAFARDRPRDESVTPGGAINRVPRACSSKEICPRIDGGSFDTLRDFASAGHSDMRGAC